MVNKIINSKYQQMDLFYEMLKKEEEFLEDYKLNCLRVFRSCFEQFKQGYARNVCSSVSSSLLCLLVFSRFSPLFMLP